MNKNIIRIIKMQFTLNNEIDTLLCCLLYGLTESHISPL